MQVTIDGRIALQGEVLVPGDKSISHRAAIFAALAEGESEIRGFLTGEDCLSTLACLHQLGVAITRDKTTVRIQGVGLTGLREAENVLDCGNSGTTARLLLGVLAGQPFFSVLTGDASLRKRPMARVTEPLIAMGANIMGRAGGTLLPLAIVGGSLQPSHYHTPVASAQLKSAILLAGLYAEGETMVVEPEQSRDHTERMLAAFGADVSVAATAVTLHGQPRLQGRLVQVPGDISSAAFFLVAASIVPASDVLVRNVGINPSRTGILEVLQAMGATLTLYNEREESGEPVADIRVQSAQLTGVELSGALIPRLIDEIPIIVVAALFANGQTIIRDAQELRVKETDRIAAVVEEFAKLGASIIATEDGFVIEGGQQVHGGVVNSRGDHRIAMSLSIAALRATSPVTVEDAHCVAISYPRFWETIKTLQSDDK
ncbi:MAG: 3-phosphoshikimate 1-carboxyvinyltransferase [Firmicutes bacterium]|nr:3-phosphoshikimate 1-carboxyvinyltransferase [Bacillota bacterium]